jgi:hypothetical protein
MIKNARLSGVGRRVLVSRRYLRPVPVTTDARHWPKAFVWKGYTYWAEVIARRSLSDEWWDAERHSDRQYFRVQTKDFQTFGQYTDQANVGI